MLVWVVMRILAGIAVIAAIVGFCYGLQALFAIPFVMRYFWYTVAVSIALGVCFIIGSAVLTGRRWPLRNAPPGYDDDDWAEKGPLIR